MACGLLVPGAFAEAETLSLQPGDPLLAGPWGIVLAAALLIVPAVLVVVHTWRLSRAATFLRLVAVALVWAAAVVAPRLVSHRTEETPGQIVLAIDLSSSMDTADPQRTAEERAAIERLLNASSAEVDRFSRREIASRLADRLRGHLDDVRVQIVGFHDGEVLESPLDALPRPAAGTLWDTDLGPPLANARSADVATRAIVLFSDGQQNRGPVPVAAARDLRTAGIPIVAIATGSRVPPADLAVAGVVAPTILFKGAEGAIDAKVRVRGMAAQEIDVDLVDTRTRKRLDRKTVAHAGADAVHGVRFPVKFDETGVRRLEIVATPRAGDVEISTANNTSAALVRVADDKVRVLLVDDEVGWDAHYRAMALVRDPDMSVERIVFDPPRLQPGTEEQRVKAGLPKDRWPAIEPGRDDPLYLVDVIVMGDVAARHLPADVVERLEKFVAEREGTLVMIGGAATGEENPIGKLLPVEQVRRLPGKEGALVTPTDAGWRLPFTVLDDDAGLSRKRWDELPRLFGGVTGTPRPGAMTLLTAKKDPAMAVWNVGLGRVVWLGTNGTWRWRFRVGDRDHQRFWGQLVRWCAEDTGVDSRGEPTFGAKKPAWPVGVPVEIFLNEGAKVAERTSASYRVFAVDEKGAERLFSSGGFQRHGERRRQWDAKIAGLPPGSYRLDVLDVPGAVATAQRDRFTVEPPESGELIDLATNADALRTLALESGGRFLWAEDIDSVSGWLTARKTTSDVVREEHLGRDRPWVWWVMGLVMGLLTVEWIVRKRAGTA